MRDIRLQFFLTLGMLGTVGPFASVFFRERGLNAEDIGYAFVIQNLVAVLSPILMTMVADAKVDARRVLMLMSLLAAVGLLSMLAVDGVGQVLIVWTMYCVAQTAIFPLQDGVHFSQQRRQAEGSGPALPYHKVRVWGALGYMMPGVLLYYPLKSGSGLNLALAMGAVFAVLAAIQALLLQDPRPKDLSPSSGGIEARVPTLAALRILLEPRMAVFCAAIIIVYMAFSIHWAYYTIYLTEHVKLGNEWVGAANNVAMCVEIPVTFACGWLLLKFGVKCIVTVGILLMALRMGLLASTTHPWVAVGTQVFHAFLILAVSVVPHTILDQRAGDRFRHSVQALFVILISCGNAAAALIAAWLSHAGLQMLFAIGSGLCVLAAGIIVFFWRGEDAKARRDVKPPLVEPPAQPI